MPLDPIVSDVKAEIKIPRVKGVRLPDSLKILPRELVSHINILYFTTVGYYLAQNALIIGEANRVTGTVGAAVSGLTGNTQAQG